MEVELLEREKEYMAVDTSILERNKSRYIFDLYNVVYEVPMGNVDDVSRIRYGGVLDNCSVDEVTRVYKLDNAWKYTLEHLGQSLDFEYLKDLDSIVNVDNIVTLDTNNWLSRQAEFNRVANSELVKLYFGVSDSRYVGKLLTVEDRAVDIFMYCIGKKDIFNRIYDGLGIITSVMAANKVLLEGNVGVLNIPTELKEDFLNALDVCTGTLDNIWLRRFLISKCIDRSVVSRCIT